MFEVPRAWFSFWNGQRHDGPGFHEVPAPLEEIPLFVRGGAVLPLLAEPAVSLANVPPDDLLQNLELRLFPTGEAGRSRFIFHDGSEITVDDHADDLTVAFDAVARTRRYRLNVTGATGETVNNAVPAGAEYVRVR